MITLEGVPPSSQIRDELADSGQKVILNFSRGKDSLAAWIALRDSGIEVIPIHKSCPPGLEFVRRSIAMYEEHFGVHIVDLPSYGFFRMLNNFVHQPPERCAIIEGADLPQVSRDQFDQLMRLHYGQPDTWITDGVRAADSAVRRLSFKTHGAVKEKARRCSPIWDWQKKDVMGALKRDGLSLPDEYTWLGRSFDALRYDTLVPLSKHEPEDWERIKQWFPMIEMELMRGAMNGVV